MNPARPHVASAKKGGGSDLYACIAHARVRKRITIKMDPAFGVVTCVRVIGNASAIRAGKRHSEISKASENQMGKSVVIPGAQWGRVLAFANCVERSSRRRERRRQDAGGRVT